VSTKFNNQQRLQPTPAVCKKGPDSFPPGTFDFKQYPLQAYVDWRDPYSPVDAHVLGQTYLRPEPLVNLHFGTVHGDPNYVEIDLIWYPATENFGLVLQMLIAGMVIDSVSAVFTDPPPQIPFQTNMFHWRDPAFSREVYCKIMS